MLRYVTLSYVAFTITLVLVKYRKINLSSANQINPLTAGVAYIRVLIFYYHIKYHLLNVLKIKCDINQQYLKTVDLHFVKSE